jgi:hypothetical protein
MKEKQMSLHTQIKKATAIACVALLTLAVGCSGREPDPEGPQTGRLHMAITGEEIEALGIDSIEFVITNDANEEVGSRIVGVESDGVPGADAYFTLATGDYGVRMTALDAAGNPVDVCEAASTTVLVEAGRTAEGSAQLFCGVEETGGLDLTAEIVGGTGIEELSFEPSKVLILCESVTVTVVAAGGAAVSGWVWENVGAPDGAVFEYESDGNVMTFDSNTPGRYDFVVSLAGSATARLEFPIYVAAQDPITTAARCEIVDPESETDPLQQPG